MVFAEWSPHQHVEPVYGTRQQFTNPDTSPLLNSQEKKKIQSTIRSLLYYALAIDNTMLTALNELSPSQASPNMKTRKALNKLLDYAATYPNTTIRSYASDMTLYGESDAAYLVLPHARSRTSGVFYLSKKTPITNELIHLNCKTIKHVVTSAAEAEEHCLTMPKQQFQ